MNEKNKNDEIRRSRLRELIAAEGGHAKFVDAHGLSQSKASYLSQIVNGYSFGEKSAENWRKLLRLPVGFFDITDEQQPATLTQEEKRVLSLMRGIRKEARDTWIKMGGHLSEQAPERRKEDTGHEPERRHFGIPYATRLPKQQGGSTKKRENNDDGR